MNVSCDIIKDLLPLYHDEVCSDDSRAMIADHLSHCEHCRKELAAMDPLPMISQKEQNLTEAREMKQLSKRWKKGMIRSALNGVVFTLLTVAAFLLAVHCFVGVHLG